jgi:hypothetical protein
MPNVAAAATPDVMYAALSILRCEFRSSRVSPNNWQCCTRSVGGDSQKIRVSTGFGSELVGQRLGIVVRVVRRDRESDAGSERDHCHGGAGNEQR